MDDEDAAAAEEEGDVKKRLREVGGARKAGDGSVRPRALNTRRPWRGLWQGRAVRGQGRGEAGGVVPRHACVHRQALPRCLAADLAAAGHQR